MVKALILTVALALAACGTVPTPAPVENPRQVWCDHNEPRRDATETTPRAELDKINTHNFRGVEWCGWRV